MSALGHLLCAACDVELHDLCGGGCTCRCHDHRLVVTIHARLP